ncbi:hypothetical protein WMF31_07020 [Sorangium sp. So ce1036]|uniref:hypothetical protein n=1 Tax=Sorangium sp. So ce1036 TaxID=3133328 RepID=UPI003F0A12EC
MDLQPSRIKPPVRRGALVVAVGAVCAAMLVGCWDSDPCDPGQLVISNACFVPFPEGGVTGSGGAPSSGVTGSGGSGGDATGSGGSGGDATGSGGSGGDATGSGGSGGDATGSGGSGGGATGSGGSGGA